MTENRDVSYYKAIVGENKASYLKIKIHEKKVNAIKELTARVVSVKAGESHHKVDGNKEYKRFYTGFLGEAAIEEIFGVEIIDWSCGDSAKYHVPDLGSLGLRIGIKTSEVYNFPIIFKKNDCPQIINIRHQEDIVFVCGLATVAVLNTYQNDELVLSPYLRQRGTKTAFYGFSALISLQGMKDIGDLRKYC